MTLPESEAGQTAPYVTCSWCNTSFREALETCPKCGGALPALPGSDAGSAPEPPPRVVPAPFVRRLYTSGNRTLWQGVILFLVGTLFSCGGIGLIIWFSAWGQISTGLRKARHLLYLFRHGQTVTGTITGVDMQRPFRLNYKFQVEGREHVGRAASDDPDVTARRVGQPVHVLYAERDPRMNTVFPPLHQPVLFASSPRKASGAKAYGPLEDPPGPDEPVEVTRAEDPSANYDAFTDVLCAFLGETAGKTARFPLRALFATFLAAVLSVVLGVGALILYALYTLVFVGSMPEVGDLALEALRANPAAVELLGTPIRVERGSYSYPSAENPDAQIASMTVSGPVGSGTLSARASRASGPYELVELKLQMSGSGEMMDLLEKRSDSEVKPGGGG